MIADQSQILHDALYDGPLSAAELSAATKLSIAMVWETLQGMQERGEVRKRVHTRAHELGDASEYQRVVFEQCRTHNRSRV